MQSEIRIRRARTDEVRRLTDLARAAKASWGYPADWIDAWQAELTLDSEVVSEDVVVVAEIGGAVVGFAALRDREDPAELEHLWVDPGAQRRGVGRALLNEMVETGRGRGCTVVRIESDPHAGDFYRRLGAQQVGEVAAPMPGDPDRALPVFHLWV